MNNERKDILKTETHQYIALMVGEEQFGVDIQNVESILKMQKISRVPKAPDYIDGVINVRGEIIPVMSLRKRFGLAEDVFDKKTRIVIVRNHPKAVMGIIVDGIREVVDLSEDQIDRIPIEEGSYAGYITGVGRKSNHSLISLLDLTQVIGIKLSDEE